MPFRDDGRARMLLVLPIYCVALRYLIISGEHEFDPGYHATK